MHLQYINGYVYLVHVKNGAPDNAFYLGQLCQPFIQNTDQLRSGLWLIEADGRCGQMSVDRLGWLPRGSKLHQPTCNAASLYV